MTSARWASAAAISASVPRTNGAAAFAFAGGPAGLAFGGVTGWGGRCCKRLGTGGIGGTLAAGAAAGVAASAVLLSALGVRVTLVI